MRAVAVPWLCVLTCAAGCGGSTPQVETPKTAKTAPAPAPVPAAAAAPPVESTTPAAAEPVAATRPGDEPPATVVISGVGRTASKKTRRGADTRADAAGPAERLEAGEISRATLLAVLSSGIGRFLQKVRAEPDLVGGRFVGWRLLSLFENEPAIRSAALQPGDTVMRVNGQSIERPEQFKNVWDSMATESELVLLVQRAGKRTEVRYRIVDAR